MRMNRLFEILYLLLDKQTVTALAFSERFEVSTRTIYRDIETLSSAGIPIYMHRGRGGGISLLPHFTLDKTLLTKAERESILTSLAALDHTVVNNDVSTLSKLASLFGGKHLNWIEVDFNNWLSKSDKNTYFDALKEAIFKRLVVTFSYIDINNKRSNRQVEPLKLCFKSNTWYLYGYCKQRLDYRFFKLKRMSKLEMTDTVNVHHAPEHVLKQEDYLKEHKIKVKLSLSSQVAYRVYDEFETYSLQEDGSFIVEETFKNNQWLFHYLFTFGSHCEILEPSDLRLSFAEVLNTMLAIYK